jgi:chromosome segregation ATPase
MSKKKNGASQAPVINAAYALTEAIDTLERVTVRCGKLELTTRNEISHAGELMGKAAESHRAFLACLGDLTQAVGALRDRQNASAALLSQQAERLDERRKELEALEQRFAALGDAAREIGEAMKSSPTEPEAMKANLLGSKDRIAAAVELARALSQDAKDAKFTDLDSQAHAIRQQLAALLRKIDELA